MYLLSEERRRCLSTEGGLAENCTPFRAMNIFSCNFFLKYKIQGIVEKTYHQPQTARGLTTRGAQYSRCWWKLSHNNKPLKMDLLDQASIFTNQITVFN